ncbi:MAG: DUF3394 domain-containing protein, partial [Propionivibrio sp.]
SFFRPNFWMDMIYPPYTKVPSTDLMQIIEKAEAGDQLRVWIEGENLKGDVIKKGMLLPLGEAGAPAERLMRFGLGLMPSGGEFNITAVKFRSKAEKAGYKQGQIITGIEIENHRPDPAWMFIPTFGVLGLIVVLQRRRIAAAKR